MDIIQRYFYINVTGVNPSELVNYIKEAKSILLEPESQPINDLKERGLWEDFFLPSDHTRIEIQKVSIDEKG